MAEKERPQRTPQEQALHLNSGAAYAVDSGDNVGGMGLVLDSNKYLREDPTNRLVLSGAMVYLSENAKYEKAVAVWERDGKKGDAPKENSSPEYLASKVLYETLVKSAGIRSDIFEENYAQLTIGQAQKYVFNGEMPKKASDKAKSLVSKFQGEVVGKTQDKTAQAIANQFLTYHVRGNTARRVQEMKMLNNLEALASNA